MKKDQMAKLKLYLFRLESNFEYLEYEIALRPYFLKTELHLNFTSFKNVIQRNKKGA